MQAKTSTLSVHQDGGSRINRHKPERFTHREELFVALIVRSHNQFVFLLLLNELTLTFLLHLVNNAVGSFV